MTTETLQDRLREVAASRGLTLKAFAAELNEDAQRVHDVLRGKQKLPAEMIVAAVLRFGVDANWLLTGSASPLRAGLSQDEASRLQAALDGFLTLPDGDQEKVLSIIDALVLAAVSTNTAKVLRKRVQLKDLQDQGHTRSIRRREHGSEPKGTNTTKVTAKGKGTIAIGSIHGGTQTIKPSKA